MNNCSYCGRPNPADVAHCRECGTALAVQPGSSASGESIPSEDPASTVAEKRMMHGLRWCIGGGAVTTVTYLAASSGPGAGTYFVAWGAILYGIVQIVQGLTGRKVRPGEIDQTVRDDLGYDALSLGTRLEGLGRVDEALAVYQKVIELYPDSGAAHDAQKSMESLRMRVR